MRRTSRPASDSIGAAVDEGGDRRRALCAGCALPRRGAAARLDRRSRFRQPPGTFRGRLRFRPRHAAGTGRSRTHRPRRGLRDDGIRYIQRQRQEAGPDPARRASRSRRGRSFTSRSAAASLWRPTCTAASTNRSAAQPRRLSASYGNTTCPPDGAGLPTIGHSATASLPAKGVGMPFDPDGFIEAQDPVFDQVLQELRDGRKRSHWMWFVFPQLSGLGHSAMAQRYASPHSMRRARICITRCWVRGWSPAASWSTRWKAGRPTTFSAAQTI